MVPLLAQRYGTKSNIKLVGFRSQVHTSSVSSYTEELSYNEAVCLSMTLHLYIYIYIYIYIYFSFAIYVVLKQNDDGRIEKKIDNIYIMNTSENYFFYLLRTFFLISVVFVLFLLSLRFGQISPLAFFRWFTATSDRNDESCIRRRGKSPEEGQKWNLAET